MGEHEDEQEVGSEGFEDENDGDACESHDIDEDEDTESDDLYDEWQ